MVLVSSMLSFPHSNKLVYTSDYKESSVHFIPWPYNDWEKQVCSSSDYGKWKVISSSSFSLQLCHVGEGGLGLPLLNPKRINNKEC